MGSVLHTSFGPSLLAPRLAHAVLGAITVVLTYALGARVSGRGAGLVAAAFVAFLPEMAGFTALFYTAHLFLPLAVGALLVLLSALQNPALLVAFMTTLFAVHFLSMAVSRHRLPFIPVLAVGAGAFYHQLARDRASLRPLLQPARIAGAAMAASAVVLVWISFFAERC